MNERLYRSSDDRMLGGVCAGIADYFGVDPSIVRVLYALLAVLTAIVPLLIVYVLLAVVLPEAPTAFRDPSAVAGPPGDAPDSWRDARLAERAARRESRRADRARRGSPEGTLVLGAGLVVVGVALLAGSYVRIDWDVVWPLIVIGLGVLLVVGAMTRGR